MKIKYLILIFVLFSVNCLYSQRIVILHTNDMHSKLTGFGPEALYSPLTVNNDNTLGGFARLATLIKEEKAKNPNNVFVCDAGDFLMGTVFQSYENKTGFQLSLMKEMGYDVVTFGNHEFDFGPLFLGEMIEQCVENKSIPKIVNSQMIFDANSNLDDKLENFVKNGTIKPYEIFSINGLKVGVFGLIGIDAVNVVPTALPVIFSNAVKNAQIIAKTLREVEKVDIIICISHSGVYPDEKGNLIGEDIDLAKKVKDIDIIISGHTHLEMQKYLQIGKTIIVQTGDYAKNLGRLEIEFKDKKVSVIEYKLIPVDDKIKGDEVVNKKIEDYKLQLNNFFAPVNLKYDSPIASINYTLEKGSYDKGGKNLGFFVADAINYYVDNFSTGTDIVLVAEGIIREDILPGVITPADIFRVAPLGSSKNDYSGYSLSQVYITGFEIKKLMELIIFANKPGENGFLYFSGVEAQFNSNKMMLNKVTKVFIDGKEINTSKKDKKLYSITANTYLLSFIGEVKKMSKGLIVITPKDKNGNPAKDVNNYLLDFDKNKDGVQEGKEWVAIIEFLKQFEKDKTTGLPQVNNDYEKLYSRIDEVSKK